jgi:NhaP-type Na+/H+ or K+/H+ antiporter
MNKTKIILKYIVLLILGSVIIAIVTNLIFPANIAPSISFLLGMLYGSPLAIKLYEEIEECEVENER